MKWENLGGEPLMKRAILCTSAKLKEAKILRKFDLSKGHDHDVFGNNNFK